ncbi:hypothetical protein AtubIFM57258_006586 [Aspergillus tubingensis]|nr:hypothetical protein AtubIFM57258_006586 [Aspergillus tubingensis]
MAAPFFAPHPSTPQPQLFYPSPSSSGHQPQSPWITRENAQLRLPTNACVHVGNLSSGVSPNILQHELEQLFSQFGVCWAQDRSHAQAAIGQHQNIFLRDRPLRVEAANGLGNRGESVVNHDGRAGLNTSPLYMPSMAIPPSQPMAYGPPLLYSWSPAVPVHGSLHVPPPVSGALPPAPSYPTHPTLSSQASHAHTPQSPSSSSSSSSNNLDTQPTTPGCDEVVEYKANQEQEGIETSRSNLPCDMLLSTGRTVRDYVNEMKRVRGIDLNEEATLELILEVEEEARDQGLLPVSASKPD